MLAGSMDKFLNNYRAFFTELTRTGTQALYINSLGGIVQVYYSDCSAYSVEIWDDTQIGVRFTISLVAPVVSWVDAGGDIRYRVVKDSDLGILADEQGRIITFN